MSSSRINNVLFKVKTINPYISDEIYDVINISAFYNEETDTVKHCFLCIDSFGNFVRFWATDCRIVNNKSRS